MNAVLNAARLTFIHGVSTSLLYRGSMFLFAATESISNIGLIAFWYQVAGSTHFNSGSGYTPHLFVAYFLWAGFHHSIQDHGASREIGSDIRLGKLSYAIIRPYPYLLQAFSKSMAVTITRFFVLAPIAFLLFVLWPDLFKKAFLPSLVALPSVDPRFWMYPTALALACLMAIATRMTVGLMAFRMSQIWGPDTMFIAAYFATSGAVFPSDMAPSWLMSIMQWSPPFYMTGFPTLILLGRIDASSFPSHLLRGAFVLVVLALLIRVQWRRGITKFEALGT